MVKKECKTLMPSVKKKKNAKQIRNANDFNT